MDEGQHSDLRIRPATMVPMIPMRPMFRYQNPSRVESGHRGCRVTATAPRTVRGRKRRIVEDG